MALSGAGPFHRLKVNKSIYFVGSPYTIRREWKKWHVGFAIFLNDVENFMTIPSCRGIEIGENKVREKSWECHNHKPQPFSDPKRKRKPTNLNKHKPNKRTKSTKISSLLPKRGNRNTKRTEKHKNKMTHGNTYNKSPRRIDHKATKSKTNTTYIYIYYLSNHSSKSFFM